LLKLHLLCIPLSYKCNWLRNILLINLYNLIVIASIAMLYVFLDIYFYI